MRRLTLIRHGQSILNQQNRFTGWIDVSLSPTGVEEAQRAAALLIDQRFDLAFTSTLLRAQDTLYEILRHPLHVSNAIVVRPYSVFSVSTVWSIIGLCGAPPKK